LAATNDGQPWTAEEDDLRAEEPRIEAAAGACGGRPALPPDLQFASDSVGYRLKRNSSFLDCCFFTLPKGGQSLGYGWQLDVEEK